MSLNITQLIARVRRAARLERYSTTEGYSDDYIIDYLNDGQELVQGAILRSLVEYEGFDQDYTCVPLYRDPTIYLPSHPSYSTASPVYASLRSPGLPWCDTVSMVEYSQNSDAQYFLPLDQSYRDFVDPVYAMPPVEFCNGYRCINLSPCPSSAQGLIRVTFPRKVDTLDKFRGTVSSFTDTGTYYSTIVLANDSILDATTLATVEYVSVVYSNGTVWSYNIPISSYNSGTYTLTVKASTVPILTAPTGTVYVVNGQYACNHSNLMPEADKYIIAYAAMMMQNLDYSKQAAATKEILSAIDNDLIKQIQCSNKRGVGITNTRVLERL